MCWPLADPQEDSALWSQEYTHQISNGPCCIAGDRFVVTQPWWDREHGESIFQYGIYSIKTGECLREVEGPDIAGDSLIASWDGQHIAGLLSSRVIVMSIEDISKPAAILKNDSRKHFTGIAFHPSGRYLAATSNDATVKLFDTTTWQVAKTYTWAIGRMRSIAFSPDGTLAAAGSDTGKIVVWDVDL